MNFVKNNLSLYSTTLLSRGVAYFKQSLVQNLRFDGKKATATVIGTKDYQVTMTFDEKGQIKTSHCSCPDQYHKLCKHTAAVLYALSAQNPNQETEGPMNPNDFEEYVIATVSASKDYAECLKKITDCYLEKSKDWGEHFQLENLKCIYREMRPLIPSEQQYFADTVRFLETAPLSKNVLIRATTGLIYVVSKPILAHTHNDKMDILLSSEKIRIIVDGLLANRKIPDYIADDFRKRIFASPETMMKYYSDNQIMEMLKRLKEKSSFWDDGFLIDPFAAKGKTHLLDYLNQYDPSYSSNDSERLSVYFSERDYQKGDFEALKYKVNRDCKYFAPIYYLYRLVMEDSAFGPSKKKEIVAQLQKASSVYQFSPQFALLTGQKVMASEMAHLSLFDYLLLSDQIQELKFDSYLKRISKWFHDRFTNRRHIHTLFRIMDVYGEKHPEVLEYLDKEIVQAFSPEAMAEYLNILKKHHGLMSQNYMEYLA